MKNTKYFLALAGTVLSLSSFLNTSRPLKENPPVKSKEVSFVETSFSTALKKAKAEQKYIFIDAYATWCGPCKKLKTTTFKDSQVSDFFNKNFVNVSIDMERGEGIDLAMTWDVEEYPTLLILDYNGKVLLRSIGYLDAKQMNDFGKQALQKK